MTTTQRILIVEDGTEYRDAFERLTAAEASPPAFTRVSTLEEAAEALAAGADALFLDVVFDRVPEGRLTGDLEALIARFGGDRARAVRHLAENQGFYLLDALAPLLPAGLPVVLAYDFSAEPQRLEALKRRAPGLVGLPEGAAASHALRLLLGR